MDIGLFVTFAGVLVAGLAGILGVWMERDKNAPAKWGYIFSGLIVIATCVELSHGVAATAEQNETDAKLARALEAMAELAASGDNPALGQFVGAELAVQARANPDVVKKMEESVAEKGGDPKAILAKAAEGRRSAAGLPKKAPEPGETPKLGAAFAGQSKGTKKRGKAKAMPAEGLAGDLAEGALGGALGGGAAGLTSGAAGAGAAALGDAKGSATKAVGDAKGSATKAVSSAKADAAKAADDAKAEAAAAAAEAEAQKKAAEDKAKAEADKAKAEADKAKKEAEAAKKKADDAKKKAKGLFGK
ncbi:MAG: hypothetical protein GY884_32870 [Proteobacteria bacterium]|nr:hypothetical protein [Pseudomonadota bacterium]